MFLGVLGFNETLLFLCRHSAFIIKLEAQNTYYQCPKIDRALENKYRRIQKKDSALD